MGRVLRRKSPAQTAGRTRNDIYTVTAGPSVIVDVTPGVIVPASRPITARSEHPRRSSYPILPLRCSDFFSRRAPEQVGGEETGVKGRLRERDVQNAVAAAAAAATCRRHCDDFDIRQYFNTA